MDAQEYYSGDSYNFVLKDFCASVGVTYQPEYREAILRSFVRKDLPFFKWLFNTYIDIPFINIALLRGGISEGVVSHTDTVNPNLSLLGVANDKPATTDGQYVFNEVDGTYVSQLPVLYTDMLARSGYCLVVDMEADLEKVFFKRFNKFSDLFYLVLPARLSLIFNFK